MVNDITKYIFNLYIYLLNLRDTMEFTIEREHTKERYLSRKEILTKGILPGSALGNFLDNNKESGDKIRERLNEFLGDIYADDSTILKITEDGKLRVDHTQHIKLFDEVVGLQESVRDIVYGYLNFAKSKNESNEALINLMVIDERMTRVIIAMLIMREFRKSFGEFQKVMAESKGQPTPQANFIVQNEISKMASLIRFSRAHAHCTDNETLDLLDDVNKVIEMTEGRRDRRDNKSFPDIFNDIERRLNDAVAKLEPQFAERFQILQKQIVESDQAAQKAPEEPQA